MPDVRHCPNCGHLRELVEDPSGAKICQPCRRNFYEGLGRYFAEMARLPEEGSR